MRISSSFFATSPAKRMKHVHINVERVRDHARSTGRAIQIQRALSPSASLPRSHTDHHEHTDHSVPASLFLSYLVYACIYVCQYVCQYVCVAMCLCQHICALFYLQFLCLCPCMSLSPYLGFDQDTLRWPFGASYQVRGKSH